MDQQKEQLLKLSQHLVNDLDKLLETGNWEESLFLRAMSKRISAIRDEAQELEEKLTGAPDTTATPKTAENVLAKPSEGYINIYISLYQANGNNLVIWQNMLKSLTRYCINRPIYNNEEHVRELIRSKPDQIKHAYVIVALKKDEVVASETQKTDAHGHELFTIKEHAINVKNIVAFVHNNKIYNFKDNKLQLQG